jgi:hypothetical protein
MVNVPKLIAAVDNLAWRHGVVTGNAVTHRLEPNGSHVITITVPPVLVEPASVPKEVEPKPLT